MSRSKSAFFVAVCGALLLLSQKTAAQEMRRIYYGTSASPAHLPVWVARDAGLFARHGLNVEPVQVRGGSLITLAIITGDLPFSGVGAESVVAARAAGGDVAMLACPIDADPVYLITRPEIKSPAALTTRYAIPFLERGWPVLVDLSKTDLVYPASCVTSSRAFIRAEPKTTEDFLRAYVAAIHRIRNDQPFAEKSFSKWLREKDPAIVKRSVAAYARLFKPAPVVPDKGIENVVRDLMRKRPEFKEYLGWPGPFRENGPLEKVLLEK